MEYFSVRVELSACESNRLGVFNPLSIVKKKIKKISVCTDNEILRFLQLRFICLRNQNRFKMVTQARTVRNAAKRNQLGPFATKKTAIITLHTSSLSLTPSVEIFRLKKARLTPLKKKDH